MNELVKLEVSEEGICIVRMEAKEVKNTFTSSFIHQLKNAFAYIANQENLKVVVITGYDNFFCCGGSKEELRKIYSGEVTFEDFGFYDLLLRCPIPVVAAMQGHAIGGGLAFGCFADFVVMAKESIYSANFMKYGFTPGMGATYIVPYRFGTLLGNEMLFSAKNYYGEELKQRGVQATVVSRIEVFQYAMDIAIELAEKPREALVLLKKHLNQPILQNITRVIEQELAMHAVTFKGQDVINKIENKFGA